MLTKGKGYSEMKEKLNQQQMKTKLKGENKQSKYMQFTFHQVSKPVAFLSERSVVSLDANSNTRGGLRFFTFLPVDVAN